MAAGPYSGTSTLALVFENVCEGGCWKSDHNNLLFRWNDLFMLAVGATETALFRSPAMLRAVINSVMMVTELRVARVTAATVGVVYGSVKLAVLKSQAASQRKVAAKH